MIGPAEEKLLCKKKFTNTNTNTNTNTKTNTIGARQGEPAVRQLLRNTNTIQIMKSSVTSVYIKQIQIQTQRQIKTQLKPAARQLSAPINSNIPSCSVCNKTNEIWTEH